MRQYWSALQTSFDDLQQNADPGLALLAPVFAKIAARLEALTQTIHVFEQCRHPPGIRDPDRGNVPNLHQAVRDCFKDISHLCAAGRGELPADREACTHAKRRAASDLLDHMALLANELKRHHYTRAVHADVRAYADDTARVMRAAVPGVVFIRPGSETRHTNETRFGARASDFHLLGAVGPVLSAHFQTEKIDSIEDDLDVVAVSTNGIKAKGGVQAKFGRIFTSTGKGAHVVNLFATITGYRAWSSYVQYANVTDRTKADVVLEGKRKWKWLHRSGDTGSAGAKYHRFKHGTGRIIRTLMGRTPVRPGYATPVVMQQKSSKGAYNAAAINELSGRVAAGLDLLSSRPAGAGMRNLNILAAQAYPSVPVLFARQAPDAVEAASCSSSAVAALDEPIARDLPKIFNPVTDIYPVGTLSGARGGSSQRKTGIVGEAGALFAASDFADQGANKGRFPAQMTAALEHINSAIDFQRLHPAHTLLDPGYNKSVERSRSVLDCLEEMYQARPKLHLHHRAEAAAARGIKKFQATELQVAQGIDNQNKALAATRSHYLKFVALAGFFNTIAHDQNYRKSLPASVLQKFDDDLEKFIRQTFGLTKATVGEHAPFRDKLFADPAFFMIETYDAISIAFGGIGVQIYETKEKLQENTRIAANVREALVGGVSTVDASFSELRNILDQVHLPIDPDRLLRSGAVEMVSLAASESWKVDLNLAGGFSEAPLQNLAGNAGDPTATVKNPHQTQFKGNVGAATAGAGITGALQWKDVRVHGNTVRTGIFRQIKLNIQGIGICAPAMEAVIVAGVTFKKDRQKSVVPGDRAEPLDKSTTDFIASTWKLLARSEMGEYDAEGECVWNYREPPKGNGKQYESTMQNVRFIRRRTARNAVDIGVPLALSGTPVAVTVHAGHTRIASTGNVLLELMGSCPSYNILMFPSMRQALCLALRTGVDALNTAKPLAQQYDFDKLRALFMPQTNATATSGAAEHNFDAQYMLHKYFGSPETIVGTMEKFLSHFKNKRRFHGSERPNAGVLNEFDRFDNDSGLWDTICLMGKSEALAPGNLPDRHGNAREPFGSEASNAAFSRDPRPRLSLQEARAIRESRRYFRMNPDMGSAERMHYFLGPDSAHGQIAFNAYCRVIAAYELINSAAKSNIGYKYEVRNRDLNHRAQ